MGVLDDIKDEMRLVYLHDDRPWMIGFSGGKDSTLLTSLALEMIASLSPELRRKRVYIVSSDTGVDNPVAVERMRLESQKINKNCGHLGAEAHIVCPAVDKSFWSCLLGKGYQLPEMPYIRWCTKSLKIDPMNRFVWDVVDAHGEVVILTGERKGESTSRNKRLSAEDIEGRVLVPHAAIPRAYAYHPLKDIPNGEVWAHLLAGDGKTPWGSDNNALYAMYRGRDLPEEDTALGKVDAAQMRATGGTRFGCWVCTVCLRDDAMRNFVENGHEELRPLMDFRKWLLEIKNDPSLKNPLRKRAGKPCRDYDREKGFGTFSLEGRRTILKRVLELEEETGLAIISCDELRYIDWCWDMDGDLSRRSLVDTYYEVKGRRLPWDGYKKPAFSAEQVERIREMCVEHGVDYELFSVLAAAVGDAKLRTRSRRTEKEFDRIMGQAWVTYRAEEDALMEAGL